MGCYNDLADANRQVHANDRQRIRESARKTDPVHHPYCVYRCGARGTMLSVPAGRYEWEDSQMTDRSLPWGGGCRCERVRIRVAAMPILTMACHCRGCQRMSASAYSLSAMFPSSGFEVTVGEPVIGGMH